MPQVDMQVSACAGGITGGPNDSKIACETLAVDDPPLSDLPDFAPASFFLSKDAELEWLDRNAFIERKDSGKGGSLHSTPHPCSSHKYCLSVKSKPSFIGLPKVAYGEAKPRRPPSIRLFPKRPSQSSKSNSGRKSDALVTDPSSPKVSCIGRVRSRRDRSLRKKNRQKQPDHPAIKRSRSTRSHKTGFWSNFLSIFGSRGHKRPEDDEPGSEPAAGTLKKSRSSGKRSLAKSKSLRKRSLATAESSPSSESTTLTLADPPCPVAVKQFTSGRRSAAWAADLEVDGATKLE